MLYVKIAGTSLQTLPKRPNQAAQTNPTLSPGFLTQRKPTFTPGLLHCHPLRTKTITISRRSREFQRHGQSRELCHGQSRELRHGQSRKCHPGHSQNQLPSRRLVICLTMTTTERQTRWPIIRTSNLSQRNHHRRVLQPDPHRDSKTTSQVGQRETRTCQPDSVIDYRVTT